jgi:carbon storage regulator
MLVMTRRRDESILVDRNIEITVVEIRGDKVRLGITAPKEVPVHRREVFEAIHGIEELSSAPAASLANGFSDVESRALELSGAHLALLDRLCASLSARGGPVPRREQALAAILSAIHEAEETAGEPVSLERLKESLVNAIKATAHAK